MNRFKLFGGVILEAKSGPITGRAAQRHRVALLTLLATTRRGHRSRDQLVTFLWPNSDVERGRKLLSDSIYRLNQALGGDAIIGIGEDVRLNRDQVGSDVADFEAAMDSREWRRAVELYTGPFVDGFFLPDSVEFDQWMEGERIQYARQAAKAMEMLAVEAADAGRSADAVECWQHLAALVPDDSRVAMELMRALEAAGNRAGALRHARIHAAMLRESLGLEPDRAVLELAEQIAARADKPRVNEPSAGAALESTARNPASITPEPPLSYESVLTEQVASPATATAATPVNQTTPTQIAVPKPPRPWFWLLSAAIALAVVAGIVVVTRLRGGGSVAAADTTSASPRLGSAIAVLPFSNLGASDTNAYFADGISEELMYLLARTPGLHVASPTSAFAYRDMKLDVREVARRLRVDWILEGSVRRSGSKLRIVAQLTDAKNGYQLWSESFDRTASDVLDIQQDIAAAIAKRLAAAVAGPVGSVPTYDSLGVSSPDTYDVYLRARFQWHRRTEESLKRSAKLFEQVVSREPKYARAWAGLADAYAVMAFYDYMPPRVAYPLADSAAHHAIALDSLLAAPYATLAYVNTYYHWDWVAAENGFRRAISIDPAYSTAHQWYSNLLTSRGRFAEAEREMRRAAEVDPLSLIAQAALGWVFVLANANDNAIRVLANTLQSDPNFQLAHYWTGQALEQAGKPSEAIAALHRALELSPRNPLVLAALAHAHASAGNADSARVILEGLLQREKAGEYVSSYELGKLYQALGDVPSSLARLERAYRERAHSMAFLTVDPQLRPLASEPRFQKLVALVDHPRTDGKGAPATAARADPFE